MAKVEVLRFAGCPNRVDTRALLDDVIADVAPRAAMEDIDA